MSYLSIEVDIHHFMPSMGFSSPCIASFRVTADIHSVSSSLRGSVIDTGSLKSALFPLLLDSKYSRSTLLNDSGESLLKTQRTFTSSKTNEAT